jgi:formyltetrahydrofolate deformylase
MHPPTEFVLTLSCPDRPGIVKAVSTLLYEHGANIVEAAQFGDAESGRFFMRTQFRLEDSARHTAIQQGLSALASPFALRWQLFDAHRRVPTLVMVSRQGHCLNDLLFRSTSEALPIDIRGVVSNHRDFEDLAALHKVPFHHLPVTPENKSEAEARLLSLVAEQGIELVVLARYMQILSPSLCEALSGNVINIHHSFLPSFKGAAPYAQAHRRGVKLVGATAHYVTADLDEGPIIEQSVVRVNHGMDAKALTGRGRDVECNVLATAVRWHAQRRVLLNGERTVVFA